MKIAFIDVTATVSFGGIQTAIWELAIALTDAGHEVTVLGGIGPIQPNLRGRPVQILQYPFTPRERVLDLGNRFRRLWERWSMARHAKQTVIEHAFDWVILTKPFDFFWPYLMPKGQKTRFAFMSGGTSFIAGDRRLFRRIATSVACSHFNAWQIQKRYKQFPQVIFNGVDVELFTPQAASELRQSLQQRPDELLFTFTGRLVGLKGLAFAIEAMQHLQDLPLRLIIIGNGEDEARLKRLATNLPVTFIPAVPHSELPRYYAASDVGVFPSIVDEAFGISIAEAMSSGLPVIGSYIGGIPEVIGNEGQSGLLVPPAKARALAAAMRQLAQDATLRQRMGASARQRIVSTFTWQQSAARLMAALEQA